MALEDYIPNIFGGTPTIYQGLLSPQEQTALEKRSNIAGLLGSVAALAQGMGAGGAPRSAFQNIANALAAGYGGAGQTFQAGVGQMAEVQKLQQSRAQIDAINQLLKDPRVANDPMMQAYIRANPAEAIKYFAEMAPLQQALTGAAPSAAPIAPTPAAAMAAPEMPMPEAAPNENVLPGLTVTAPPLKLDPLDARKQELLAQNNRLSNLPTKTARDIIANNLQQIETLDKQIARRSTQEFDFAGLKANVPAQFKQEVEGLEQLAMTGGISGSDLRQGLQDINKRATEFVTREKDYTNEDRRVAAKLFPNKSIRELSAEEIGRLDQELYNREIQKRLAGRTVIDMGTREMEKEFAKGVVEDTRASFQQAKSAVNTLKAINTLKPILSAGRQEKLQRTAIAMQKLASLELSAAEAMKGQGAITENERSLIARAAGGNLRDFTATEVQALLGALETVAQQKIASHQQNYEVMSQDPVGRKYSKYYNIEAPTAPVKKYNPATGRIE